LEFLRSLWKDTLAFLGGAIGVGVGFGQQNMLNNNEDEHKPDVWLVNMGDNALESGCPGAALTSPTRNATCTSRTPGLHKDSRLTVVMERK
jgi:hypothetical protein